MKLFLKASKIKYTISSIILHPKRLRSTSERAIDLKKLQNQIKSKSLTKKKKVNDLVFEESQNIHMPKFPVRLLNV